MGYFKFDFIGIIFGFSTYCMNSALIDFNEKQFVRYVLFDFQQSEKNRVDSSEHENLFVVFKNEKKNKKHEIL